MGRVSADISVSLDGFVAGPNPSLEEPLGQGGERLHAWAFATKSFRELHGLDGGGETGTDDDVAAEWIGSYGAVVMGRKMFSGGAGGWEDDPRADGWWGDDPPFHAPVFVLTHHAREPLVKQGGTTFTFVTDGIGTAIEQAKAAAGDRDVSVGGGGATIQQVTDAGLLDEIQLHVAPVLLGAGARLFADPKPAELELTRVIESPAATHLSYRVLR